MIEPMLEAFTGDRDAEITHVGKVRQPELSRHRLLTEDDLSLGAVHRAPVPDPPFQRAPNAGGDLGTSPKDFLEDGDRPQPRRGLEHRNDLAIPDGGQWIWAAPLARPLPLRRKAGIVLEPVTARWAEPGFRRGLRRRVGLSEFHVNPHLAVGDVSTWQDPIPLIGLRKIGPCLIRRTARWRDPLRSRLAGANASGRATPSLRHRHRRLILILIDAQFSP